MVTYAVRLLMILHLFCGSLVTQAFLVPKGPSTLVGIARGSIKQSPLLLLPQLPQQPFRTPPSSSIHRNHPQSSLHRRYMFNLPPSGGNNKNDLQDIWTGIGTIVAIAVFFASPLGSLFFAITNSLFLIALLIPVLAVVAFQAWQYTNTILGSCPQCGAPVRVYKSREEETLPSLCFSCGAMVQPTKDMKGIELAPQNNVIIDDLIDYDDGYFGGNAATILDSIWNQARDKSPQDDSPTKAGTKDGKASQYRRERTVIDVDVEEDE